jgi:hypothetical protein
VSMVADYWGYRNWITGHTALLIDSTESTHNTKRRLALNALRKGIGIDQLADQFRRMFKKQEDKSRTYYEDSLTANCDERGGFAGKRSGTEAADGCVEPMGECDWRAIAWNAAEEEEQKYKARNRELKEKAGQRKSHDKQSPEFRFRLNGAILPQLFTQRELIHGEAIGEWQIAVDIDGIGRFTIDDNSNLWDPALPQFVLEFRDETSWALLPIPDRQASKDKGWNRVTPQELVAILQSEGIISTE